MASSKWFTVCLILSMLTNSFAMSFTYAKNRRHEVSANCPTDCHCFPINDNTIQVQCSSSKHLDEFLDTENLQITKLDLSNTSIETLDKRLKKLPNLQVLNLTANKLTDLRNFPTLPKLTHLYLRANKIKSFSAKWLPSGLKHLDVSHNRVRELPHDLLRMGLLNELVVAGNPFTCSRKSLDLRDSLLERNVQLIGHVYCNDPDKFKGKSWLHAVDFDEFFKLHDQDDFQGDEGSGVGFDRTEVTTDLMEVTTDSDFLFDGSGDVDELPFVTETHREVLNAPEVTTSTENPNLEATLSADLERNLGIKVFLVIFLICLVSLLIYSIKKNKEKKRLARQNKRKYLDETNQELMSKPLEKLPYSSVINGQNGNQKAAELGEDSVLLRSKPLAEENGDKVIEMKPLYPEVKSVTVRRSEIPDSVPHTPILITRSKSSDGKHIVVTPNLNRIP